MTYYYSLKVETRDSETSDSLNALFGVDGRSEGTSWEYSATENEADPHVGFITIFADMVLENLEKLRGLGVEGDDISVWLLYEYDGQCNMEFSPAELAKLGKAGVTLCVSCWDSDEGGPNGKESQRGAR